MPSEQVQQQLADMPTWMLVLIALAGLAGEMYRGEMAGLATHELVKRICLRTGASIIFGVVTVLLCVSMLRLDLVAGAALGALAAVLGADLAGALYTRWLARKAGADLPNDSPSQN